ncbi:3-oxoacyl-ACP reductase FabG [Buchnera aphidicola (Ceratovacuna keduensis)]|uniref:3-oxoacyl-ACP reductase FabG n=1 Tax=Buchnera aphidicola TaxID=9 RepID=UPI0031B89200
MKKKVAIITGANSGIGKEISKKLSKKGIIVIGTTSSKNGLINMKKFIKNKKQRFLINFKKPKNIKKIISKIYNRFGSIDILINNTGSKKDKIILNMTKKNWSDIIKINLTSTFLMSKNIIKYMIKNKYGRIVHISSIIGNIGNIGQSNYSASKYGIIGFNKSLALEVAKYGITSNVISPGFIKTKMTKKIKKEKKNIYIKKIPVKRFGTVKDVENVITFLISKKSSYITGQTIHVNGGMYME